MNKIIHPVAVASVLCLMAIGTAHARAPNAVIIVNDLPDSITSVAQIEEVQQSVLPSVCEEPGTQSHFAADCMYAKVNPLHIPAAPVAPSKPEKFNPRMVAVVPRASASGDCRVGVMSDTALALAFNRQSGQHPSSEGPVVPSYDGAYRNGPIS